MKVRYSASHIAGAFVAGFCGIALVGIIAHYVRHKKTTWTVRQLRNTRIQRLDPALDDRNAHFKSVAYHAGTCGTLHGINTDLDDTRHGKCGEPEFDGFGFGENIIVAHPDNHNEFTHTFAMNVTTALDFSNNENTVPGSSGGDRHEFDDTASAVGAIDIPLDNSDKLFLA